MQRMSARGGLYLTEIAALYRQSTAVAAHRSLAHPRLFLLNSPARSTARQYSTDPPAPKSVPDSSPPSQGKTSSNKGGGKWHSFLSESSPARDAVLSAVLGLGILFGGGVAYLEWYKRAVLQRMEDAFAPGYDPVLEISNASYGKNKREHSEGHIRRAEQEQVDRIISGQEAGSYFILLGSRGTGKGSMMIDAMRAIDAEGCAFTDAHPDLEVFRLRLGKALNFDYYEDSQAGLFQRRDPREGGAGLDIERALNKLEKVAITYTRKHGRPLCLVINNVHLFPNDKEGHSLLHQLQTRAESWAQSGILTMVLSSDDFWPYDTLRKNASRMLILSVYDLPFDAAVSALKSLRAAYRRQGGGLAGEVRTRQSKLTSISPITSETGPELESDAVFRECVKIVGGRTSYISRLARSRNMLDEARWMMLHEREWILSQIGLIPDCDDDVMDDMKWASCSWLLLRDLAQTDSQEASPDEIVESQEPGAVVLDVNAAQETDITGFDEMKAVTFNKARQLMTRPDFIHPLDHLNVIHIDIHHRVRLDSHLTQNAVKSIVSEDGFDEMLESVMSRVNDIESLHRTREIVLKQPIRIGGKTMVIGLGDGSANGDIEEQRPARWL